MKGLEKTAPDGADRHKSRQTDTNPDGQTQIQTDRHGDSLTESDSHIKRFIVIAIGLMFFDLVRTQAMVTVSTIEILFTHCTSPPSAHAIKALQWSILLKFDIMPGPFP